VHQDALVTAYRYHAMIVESADAERIASVPDAPGVAEIARAACLPNACEEDVRRVEAEVERAMNSCALEQELLSSSVQLDSEAASRRPWVGLPFEQSIKRLASLYIILSGPNPLGVQAQPFKHLWDTNRNCVASCAAHLEGALWGDDGRLNPLPPCPDVAGMEVTHNGAKETVYPSIAGIAFDEYTVNRNARTTDSRTDRMFSIKGVFFDAECSPCLLCPLNSMDWCPSKNRNKALRNLPDTFDLEFLRAQERAVWASFRGKGLTGLLEDRVGISLTSPPVMWRLSHLDCAVAAVGSVTGGTTGTPVSP